MGVILQEKSLGRMQVLVPQTDTGRQVENTKVDGITTVKELGKLLSYLRKKAAPSFPIYRDWRGAQTRPERLFIKNTGPC